MLFSKEIAMRNIFYFMLIFFVSGLSYAEDAPFGLKWGASPQELKNLNLKKESSDANTTIYSTVTPPKNISIASEYYLIFDNEIQLQKIIMISKNIDNDTYGINGKEVYEKIKLGLKSKYNEPTSSYEQTGLKLYKDNDEFYQCLKYDGCGNWISIFKDQQSGTSIVLELNGISRGTGFIKLTYESSHWGDVVDKHDAIKTKSDNNSL